MEMEASSGDCLGMFLQFADAPDSVREAWWRLNAILHGWPVP
jgi:hypothetical protein